MKYESQFASVIRDDEKVLWTGKVNKKAYTKTILRNMLLWMLFPMFLPFLFLALTLFLPLTFCLIKKGARNIYFCITDKQVIKRKGIFTTDYQRLSLSSIGEIKLDTNIFDSKVSPESASLNLFSKNYGGGFEMSVGSHLVVPNLEGAHEAYKLISKNIDNEAVKIKQV